MIRQKKVFHKPMGNLFYLYDIWKKSLVEAYVKNRQVIGKRTETCLAMSYRFLVHSPPHPSKIIFQINLKLYHSNLPTSYCIKQLPFRRLGIRFWQRNYDQNVMLDMTLRPKLNSVATNWFVGSDSNNSSAKASRQRHFHRRKVFNSRDKALFVPNETIQYYFFSFYRQLILGI